MRLHNLKPRPGAKHRTKRLGQGESSGRGKTAGRGGKGQTARSGSSIRIGFEDGARVDELAMSSVGLSNGRCDGIKILGTGELSKKLTVIASAFSASART